MDNLLFYALLACLVWYFWQQAQKKTSRPDLSKPSTFDKETQTEALTYDVDLPGPTLVTSAPTPGSYPFSESDQKEIEQTLDFLIKELKEIDKSLD